MNTTKHISLLLPTRKRALFMHRLVSSALSLASLPSQIQFVFYIDDDDDESIKELSVIQSIYNEAFGSNTIVAIIGPRIVLSQAWNECYEQAEGTVLMHCGDDIIFRTRNWDATVALSFGENGDEIWFVYGSDGIQPDTFGTHGFIHRRAVEAVGYFVPPYFSSDYNDTWWNDVYELIGRKKHIPILTEHMHFCVGKHFKDENTLDRLARHETDKVGDLYQSKHGERRDDAEKLERIIYNY